MSESDSTTPTKVCTKCGVAKTRGEFSRHSGAKDGLHSPCKMCAAAYGAAHRDEKAAYDAVYRAEHREEIAACDAAYRPAYYAAHRDEKAAYYAAYCAEHPEELRAHWRNRRARKRNAPGTHTAADVRAQYERQKGICFWCPEKVGDTYHVDHVVPLILGGSNGKENIVIACPNCNLSKGGRHPMDFGGRLL